MANDTTTFSPPGVDELESEFTPPEPHDFTPPGPEDFEEPTVPKSAGIPGARFSALGYGLPGKELESPVTKDEGVLTSLGLGQESMPTGEELITATKMGANQQSPFTPPTAIPISSAIKLGVGVADWMTKPSGAAQMIAAMVPGLDVIMAGKFAKDMIESGYVGAKDVKEALETGDWQKVSDGAVNFVASVFGAKAVTKHGIKAAKEHLKTLNESPQPLIERGQEAAFEPPPLSSEAKEPLKPLETVEPSNLEQTGAAVTPSEFTPALKTKSGEIIVGEQGKTHSDIYASKPGAEGAMLRVEQPEHGFVRNGEFVSRESTSKLLGETEPLQSERLRELQKGVETNEKAKEENAGILNEPVSDWTSATAEAEPFPGAEPMELGAGIPIPKFGNRKMSPLDKVTTQHSGKLQKSMDEARRAQKEIKKVVPSEPRQNAISIWSEAGGDIPTLQTWAAAAKGKLFKQAAFDAQSLTPEEIAIANRAIAAFSALEKRGNTFDVLKSHRENYVPHVWDVKRPGTGFGTGMLKQRFRFSKARTFDTFFEGDQAGFKPKTLAIGKLLPAYIHEMNQVIADRQMVRDLVKGEMSDGSPMAVPTGNVKAVEGSEGKAVLVQPRSSRVADTSDYRVMQDQPALSGWTWEGKDTAGKPVFVKADMAVHPDVFRRINSTLGHSALRTWYRDPVAGLAQVPRAVARGLDTAQAAMKREMFGLLAPFHQVQEGTHAVGHLVNPFFGIPKVDLRNPAQLDAAKHGLMLLPDRASSRVYLEGVGSKTSLLSQGLRKTGKAGEAVSDVIDGYQDYLFHQYIPGLKFKTYEAMLERNTKLYADELASGEMTPADVKITTAEQANAAYGHLNYALLDRNPTIQHLIQIAALAPDFLEARTRFAGQAVKGISSKVGHEQFKAIAILAAVQAGSAAIISNLLGDEYDPTHPFEVIHKGRRYSMRSVPEDIYGLLKDTRQFIYSRVNPLIVKGAIQLGTGLNYRGEKVTPLETITELLAGYIPIVARSLPGLRSLTETGRNSPTTPLQQLAGSLGLRVSRYSPVSETYKLAGDWMDKQKLPRDRGSYPISKYQQLRYALEDGDMDRANEAYAELRKTMTVDAIRTGFKASVDHPFTGSKTSDVEFVKSLNASEKKLYEQALITRSNILHALGSVKTQ